MHLSDTTVKELLASSGIIDYTALGELMEEATKSKASLQDEVIKRKILSEADLTKLYAKAMKVGFAELANTKVDQKILNKIPERIARQYQAVLFGADKTKLKLAMADPGDLQAIDVMQKLLGKNIEIYVASATDIGHIIDQYKGGLGSEIDTEVTKVIPENDAPPEEEVSAAEVAEDSPIAKTVNLLVEYAIKANASDIHIEPREDDVAIRYRIDGVLREANTLPRKVLAALVSRIKIMANLKIDEHRKPQDGRFKIEKDNKILAIRVSTLPVMDGEKVVMRLLDETTKALTLEELGFNKSALERMQRAMAQPHGLILVTGPTGAGKSTTLYSVLSTLNTDEVNISTVEDPVEYRIEGVNQTQVNVQAGMTFASGLRALLRQDPNIIMVGEIRDRETADLAIQAALTGHLVLSTLHTNNAATTLPRLLDMGAEPFLIASTVRVVVGQRLVRKLCPDCKKAYEPTKEELAEIQNDFHLDEALKALGAESKALKLFKPGEGCATCGQGGYKSRMGIYEVLEVNEKISKLITENGTSDDIQTLAVTEGMITMQQDGLMKALQGLTTIAEILRVTRE